MCPSGEGGGCPQGVDGKPPHYGAGLQCDHSVGVGEPEGPNVHLMNEVCLREPKVPRNM